MQFIMQLWNFLTQSECVAMTKTLTYYIILLLNTNREISLADQVFISCQRYLSYEYHYDIRLVQLQLLK